MEHVAKVDDAADGAVWPQDQVVAMDIAVDHLGGQAVQPAGQGLRDLTQKIADTGGIWPEVLAFLPQLPQLPDVPQQGSVP